MKPNSISFLGILGLLGFLGPLTGNVGYYGFFGFLGFLSAFGGTGSDERLESNINRACRNSFLLITILMSLFLVYVVSYSVIGLFPLIFAILFVGSMTTFVISFIYYDRRGD
jgi:hypothetical protein